MPVNSRRPQRNSVQFGLLALAAAYLLMVTACPQPVQKDTHCSENTVCIETWKQEYEVDFYVINQKAFPVTVTLSLNTNNMRMEIIRSLTATYPGRSRSHAVRLRAQDRQARWQYRYHYHWVRGHLDAVHTDDFVYDLPYDSGHRYRVVQSYYGDFSHFGDNRFAVDFSMPAGTSIYAARGGQVVGVKDDSNIGGPAESYKHQGNFIIIEHSDKTLGEYFHLEYRGAAVQVGQAVSRGDFIGYSGQTGFADGPHLHFGVYGALNGKARRPFPIRFHTTDGIIAEPQVGWSYTAP